MPDELPILEVENLNVEFLLESGWSRAVRDVSFSVARNEIFGLVGESGSGKSVTSMSLIGLLPTYTSKVQGHVRLSGTDLLGMRTKDLDRIRGKRIGMIFQEPMSSLNPAYTIGEQIAEVVRVHTGKGRKQAWARAIEMIDRVGIPNAKRNVEQYPHQFSGGMRQRAMIAMALACSPELLIADEPTTALDVTVQALILDLIKELQEEAHMSVLLITHDLGVIAEIADRTAVMYAGEIVEVDETPKVFHEPLHPYTDGLLGSIISLDDDSRSVATIPGQVPSIKTSIEGCRFADRCSFVDRARCCGDPIELMNVHGRDVRCIRADEIRLEGL